MRPLTLQQLEQISAALAAELTSAATAPTPTSPANAVVGHPGTQHISGGPEEVARLEAALAYITSDVPRGPGKIFDGSGKPVPDYWLGVIWGLASQGSPDVKELARHWSQTSNRYDHDGFEKDWAAYAPNHSNPIGIGSVYKIAKALGWDGTVSASSGGGGRYKLLGRNDVLALPPPRWRVKHVLPEAGTAAIYGPSMSGKSLLTIDQALSIADGSDWFGYRTVACPITYVMLEGEGGLRSRIEAWEQKNGPVPENFKVVMQPFHFTARRDVDDLAAVLPSGGVVYIDTLNRAAPTSDENSSKEMGEILEAMKRLQALTQGLVVIVHHTGKDTTRGMRGHSSLHAALDAAIEVERTDRGRSWRIAKVKDGKDGTTVNFALKVHVLGQDADGEDMTSCTVEPDSSAIFIPKAPSGKNQKAALGTIKRALFASSKSGQAGCSPQTQCMTFDDAIAEVASTLLALDKNRRTNRARRLVQDLVSGGHLQSGVDANQDGWLWL